MNVELEHACAEGGERQGEGFISWRYVRRVYSSLLHPLRRGLLFLFLLFIFRLAQLPNSSERVTMM